MSLLINKAQVKKFTLDAVKERRPHLADKKTRVGGDYFLRLEAKLRAVIEQEVDDLTSVGKTIK